MDVLVSPKGSKNGKSAAKLSIERVQRLSKAIGLEIQMKIRYYLIVYEVSRVAPIMVSI